VRTGTLIIGAGQAGLALSHHLAAAGLDHVLVERGRIGERWRSERWDSLALLTPNWANRLPGQDAPADPDGFMTGAAFVDELERYAGMAPVLEHTTVSRVSPGFEVETSRGRFRADQVVLATGECAEPAVPAFAAAAPVPHLHASRYRNPGALPPGGVLVVGSGASGHQIAYELATAGRDVTLAVGRHGRVPRRYRGRDIWWWLRELGDLDRTRDQLDRDPFDRPRPALPLDGRDGGRTLDLGVLSAAGVRVAGRLTGFEGRGARFDASLPMTMAAADAQMHRVLDRIDAFAGGAGERPAPIELPDRGDAPFESVVWATGFRSQLREFTHRRGVTTTPGLYVLGARWQHRMTSHQIGGVGADAAYLAGRIAQRSAAPRLVAA
jgi:putative flavoprotein involved in K+ transport